MDDIEDELSIGHDFPEDETTNRERIKTPVNLHFYTDDKGVRTTTSFLKSYRRCLKRIRDAMLLQNWQEAAVSYNSYIQTLEAINGYTVNTTASERLRHLKADCVTVVRQRLSQFKGSCKCVFSFQ